MSRGEWTLAIACQDVIYIAMESLPCPWAISSAAAHRTSYPCFPAKKSLPFLELNFLSKKWEAVHTQRCLRGESGLVRINLTMRIRALTCGSFLRMV